MLLATVPVVNNLVLVSIIYMHIVFKYEYIATKYPN